MTPPFTSSSSTNKPECRPSPVTITYNDQTRSLVLRPALLAAGMDGLGGWVGGASEFLDTPSVHQDNGWRSLVAKQDQSGTNFFSLRPYCVSVFNYLFYFVTKLWPAFVRCFKNTIQAEINIGLHYNSPVLAFLIQRLFFYHLILLWFSS